MNEERLIVSLPMVHRLATWLNRKIGGPDHRLYCTKVRGDVEIYMLGYDAEVFAIPQEAWQDHDMQVWKAKGRWSNEYRRLR